MASVLICGLSNVGFRVASLLRYLGVAVTVVAPDAPPAWARKLLEHGARLEQGDTRDPELLRRAGIESARALLATADEDLTNLEAALDARRMRRELPIVARIFDRNLGDSLEETLGACRSLGVSAAAGPKLAWAALGEQIEGSFELGETSFVIQQIEGEIKLTRRSAYVLEHAQSLRLHPGEVERTGPTLRQVWTNAPRPLRVAVLALLTLTLLSVLVFAAGMRLRVVDALYFVVTTVTTTGYGDITPRDQSIWLKLYACCLMLGGSLTMAILFSFMTDWLVGERVRAALGQNAANLRDHVIVVGLGHVGYRVFGELELMGARVLAVETDAATPFVASLRRSGRIVIGDGRLAETMAAAGAEHARAVVATTGDDAANLSVVLGARKLAPAVRSVVRLFDAEFAEKVESEHLAGAAHSASRLAAPVFAASALCEGVLSAFVDAQGLVALCRPAGHEDGAEALSVVDDAGREHRLLVRRWPFA
jgi:voltage-gated potassium channel Kch